MLSATCIFETGSTRTCEIRGTPEIDVSDPVGPPTRTGAFIAKKAAETIKKLWMYRCFTTSSFNCVHRCVQQPRSCKRASIGVFETSRYERFPASTEFWPLFTRRNMRKMVTLLFSGLLPLLKKVQNRHTQNPGCCVHKARMPQSALVIPNVGGETPQ